MSIIPGGLPPATTLKGSRHDVVWSYDPCVTGPPARGWVPRMKCQGVRAGADIITVGSMGLDELARYKDLVLGGGHYLANLYVARVVIVAVNGVGGKAKEQWIESTYAYRPKDGGTSGTMIINLLASYAVALAEGEDPLETVSTQIEEVGPAEVGAAATKSDE